MTSDLAARLARLSETEMMSIINLNPDFLKAARWAKALGFREECARKPYFFPDGRDGSEWVLIGGNQWRH